jgi:uncharacterized surface protein with fasciclin (FAS1) repeats
MNMHLSGIIQKYLVAFSVLFVCHACTDEVWDQHYGSDLSETSDQTLWQQLQTQDSLSDFREILDSVKVMNGHKITTVKYAELLNQQYFTVFAPVNGAFNKDSLLALCATTAGNKQLEEQFIMSHLSRTPYSFSPYTNKMAHMLNGKYLLFKDSTLANVSLITEKSNIVAKNGLIHCVNGKIPYVRTVYENMVDLTEFSGMGAFLSSFQIDSLDEEASIVSGIDLVTGTTIYVDSVLIETNRLFGSFGQIDSEDSTYHMVAPAKAGWDEAYTKVSKYFVYPTTTTGADSLGRFYTNYSLMKDLFFNWTMQSSPQDSLISTQYSKKTPEQHVFYKPFGADGILNGAEQITASNGIIYQTKTWPYDMQDVFFTPITTQAEYEKNISSVNKELFNVYQRQLYADSISENGYLEINPKTPATQLDATFFIPNTLSGKYQVCVVLLPKTITNPTNLIRNKFNAFLEYKLVNGTTTTVQCKSTAGLTYFINNANAVDTIPLTTVTFPTCNYKQDNVSVKLRIKSIVTQKEINAKSFSNQMYIDCFYLKPLQD